MTLFVLFPQDSFRVPLYDKVADARLCLAGRTQENILSCAIAFALDLSYGPDINFVWPFRFSYFFHARSNLKVLFLIRFLHKRLQFQNQNCNIIYVIRELFRTWKTVKKCFKPNIIIDRWFTNNYSLCRNLLGWSWSIAGLLTISYNVETF